MFPSCIDIYMYKLKVRNTLLDIEQGKGPRTKHHTSESYIYTAEPHANTTLVSAGHFYFQWIFSDTILVELWSTNAYYVTSILKREVIFTACILY